MFLASLQGFYELDQRLGVTALASLAVPRVHAALAPSAHLTERPQWLGIWVVGNNLHGRYLLSIDQNIAALD
jgi:hypothetical protein